MEADYKNWVPKGMHMGSVRERQHSPQATLRHGPSVRRSADRHAS